MTDDDVFAGVRALVAQRDALCAAIRRHRDQRGHDRCWLDDAELYAVLPEGNTGDQRLPPREEFLAGCARYHELRQAGVAPAGTPGIAAELARVRALVAELEAVVRAVAAVDAPVDGGDHCVWCVACEMMVTPLDDPADPAVWRHGASCPWEAARAWVARRDKP